MDIKVPDFKKMAQEVLKELPKKVANNSKNHFLKSFIKEGFTDASFIPWTKRLDIMPHKILSLSYTLKNSIKIDKADLQQIVISAGNGIPYAAIHNEGGTIQVQVTEKMKKYFWAMYYKTKEERYKNMALTQRSFFSIYIPKRQFIGTSYVLDNENEKIIIDEIKKQSKKLKF